MFLFRMSQQMMPTLSEALSHIRRSVSTCQLSRSIIGLLFQKVARVGRRHVPSPAKVVTRTAILSGIIIHKT